MRHLKYLLLGLRISLSLLLIGVGESASEDTAIVEQASQKFHAVEAVQDAPQEYDYIIKVEFNEIAMVVYDRKGEKVKSFPVALPRVTPENLPIEGEVVSVEKHPFWYPTEKTREYFKQNKNIELPNVVPPENPQNAMGAVKIMLSFKTPGANPLVRIHGTNEPQSIGKRASSGCIRMHNDDVLALADMIKGKHTYVVFE